MIPNWPPGFVFNVFSAFDLGVKRERGGGGQGERVWQIPDCWYSFKPFCKGQETPFAGEPGSSVNPGLGVIEVWYSNGSCNKNFLSLALEDRK